VEALNQKGGRMKKMIPSDLSKILKEKRKKIDGIDRKLLSLLNQRLRTALEIGKVKRKMGQKIYDPLREEEALRRLALRNRGPLRKKDLEKIFQTTMEVCRKSQKITTLK
jgi:chorismate mutase/prephenate dehydratase